jgi:cytochrome c oxidase subunit 3
MSAPESELELQYESRGQQEASARLGMWVFLASELMLFAGLLALYAAYRFTYPAEFRAAAGHANVVIGTTNTYVLITSSLTVALALHAAHRGRRRLVGLLLIVTALLGVGFDVLKGIEYAEHLRQGIAPGTAYAFAALPGHGAALYFTLYYALTGLHALHVTVGIGVIVWLARRALRGDFAPGRSTVALELGGLYWHLVDVVWIFLWPLLYLVK